MSSESSNATVCSFESEVSRFLAELDLRAELESGRWAEKRGHQRRGFRAPCRINYFSPINRSIMTTMATTRDVSQGGLSFVAPAHFARASEVVIGVETNAQTTRRLVGAVVYSRRVSDGWFLTGVQFGPVDEFLMKIAIEQDEAVKAILRNPDPQ
jgi:hypothetical protein